MREFAPGPWRWEAEPSETTDDGYAFIDGSLLDANGQALITGAEYDELAVHESERHLIAAALDLYEALSAAVDWVNDDISWAEAVEMGKAALAKARGGDDGA